MPNPVEPLVFDVSHNFHILKLNFKIEAKLLEDTTGNFTINIVYRKDGNSQILINHPFHLNLTQTIPIEGVAELRVGISGGGLHNNYPVVRLQVSVGLNVIGLHKDFTIINQDITLGTIKKSEIAAIRASNLRFLTLADSVGDDDYTGMMGIPAPLTIETSVSTVAADVKVVDR